MASQYSNKVLDVISDYPQVSLLKGRFRGIVYIVSSQYSNEVKRLAEIKPIVPDTGNAETGKKEISYLPLFNLN